MELINKQESEVAAYEPFYAELAKLESDNAALVFNYETPKGNKEARSHIFSLRKTKGALERVRKEAKAEALRIGRAVDSEANAIEARIEAMITVHQAEVDKIEQREKDRVATLQTRLSAISPGIVSYESSTAVRAEMARVVAIEIGKDWDEFMAQATSTKEDVLARLAGELDAAVKREEEAAELARLRADIAGYEDDLHTLQQIGQAGSRAHTLIEEALSNARYELYLCTRKPGTAVTN